jgi:hypothetical protein
MASKITRVLAASSISRRRKLLAMPTDRWAWAIPPALRFPAISRMFCNRLSSGCSTRRSAPDPKRNGRRPALDGLSVETGYAIEKVDLFDAVCHGPGEFGGLCRGFVGRGLPEIPKLQGMPEFAGECTMPMKSASELIAPARTGAASRRRRLPKGPQGLLTNQ